MSSLILRNNKPFLNMIVTCNEKWILYNKWWWPAQWLDWEEALKHFLKPNLHQKKVMVIVWLSAACLIHYSFLNPSETIISEKYAEQINEMHQKLQCLQTELVNRKVSILFHDNAQPHIAQSTLQKLNELGYKVLSAIFTWPLDNQLPRLQESQKLFAGETLPQPAECRKCFPRVHQIPKHRSLYSRNKPT